MKSENRSPNPLSEVGFFVHAALYVIKRAYISATEGFNNFFSVNDELRGRYYRQRGVEHTRRGRYGLAVSLLEQTLEALPQDEETLFHLGFCHLKLDRPLEAIKVLERALVLGYGGVRVRSILGMAFLQTHEYDKAVQALEPALVEDPHNFHLNYRMAQALDHLKVYDRALVCFRNAAAVRPDDPKVYRFMGVTLEQMGRHEESVVQFRKAASLEEGFRSK
ncbi:MAG: tetratricopeptide repeat protein [Magnetococcales bacterium]|nr:tetratricopeptide repeat protein [Magnetococcales bacterium]MBF0151961.1 tetratricopeptide repeat protein [Magnetococcales bacterium]